MSRQTRIILLTAVVWALACVVSEFLGISAFLRSDDPSDVYDKTWGFQLIVFAIFRFPIWLLGLAAIVCGELFYFHRSSRGVRTRSETVFLRLVIALFILAIVLLLSRFISGASI